PIGVDVKTAGGEFAAQAVVVETAQLVTRRPPDDLPAFNRDALRLLGAGITPPGYFCPETQRGVGPVDFVRTNLPARR
ncbi:hypothetical protein Q6310_27180, partial [Klebsiella pneumoniae]|nr:hypothetical protein [Klebsiella pneumoniae]